MTCTFVRFLAERLKPHASKCLHTDDTHCIYILPAGVLQKQRLQMRITLSGHLLWTLQTFSTICIKSILLTWLLFLPLHARRYVPLSFEMFLLTFNFLGVSSFFVRPDLSARGGKYDLKKIFSRIITWIIICWLLYACWSYFRQLCYHNVLVPREWLAYQYPKAWAEDQYIYLKVLGNHCQLVWIQFFLIAYSISNHQDN